MDDSSLCGTSCSIRDQISVDKLSNSLRGNLKVGDGDIINCSNEMQSRVTEEYEDPRKEIYDEEEEDDLSDEELLAQMGYAESGADRDVNEPQKQCLDTKEEEEEGDDLSEELVSPQLEFVTKEQLKDQSITPPMASLNLVSALKGSRIKEGNPAEELHVSWGPEVYDPPPGYAEPFAASESERHKSERKVRNGAGKNKQKGGVRGSGASEGMGAGGSKGSKGGGKAKDKKQLKKHGRNTSRYSDFDDH